jgi:GNAT superfamily N-acetyltransferase
MAQSKPSFAVAPLDPKDAEEVMQLILRRVFREGMWPMVSENIREMRGIVAMTTVALLTFYWKRSAVVSTSLGFGIFPLVYYLYNRFIDLPWHLRSACTDLTKGNGHFYDYWSSGGRKMLVAKLDDRIAGVAAVTVVSENSLELQRVAVKEEFGGMGVARKLMEELVKYGREKKCDDILVQVTSANHRAAAVYRKFGFQDHVVTTYRWRILNWTAIRLKLPLK